IQYNPKDAEAHISRGWVLNNLERYEEALVAFDQALQIAPEMEWYWESKSYIFLQLHRYDEAIAASDGSITRRMRDLQEALLAYQQGFPATSEKVSDWQEKAKHLECLYRFEEAVAAWDQAIALDPGNADHYLKKGHTLSKLKRYEEAIAACNQALNVD